MPVKCSAPYCAFYKALKKKKKNAFTVTADWLDADHISGDHLEAEAEGAPAVPQTHMLATPSHSDQELK